MNYVVAGHKCNMVNTVGGREYTRVTKSEQIVVEHANNFFKSFRSLSTEFRHGHSLLSGCLWYVQLQKTRDILSEFWWVPES